MTEQQFDKNTWQTPKYVFDPAMQDFVQRSVSLDFIKKIGGYDGE